MSIQQAESRKLWKKSLRMRRQALIRAIASILVMLLTGTRLLGTPAFGGSRCGPIQAIGCLPPWPNGQMPDKCRKCLGDNQEGGKLVRCPDGYNLTASGTCEMSPGLRQKYLCAQCTVQSTQCEQETLNIVERCLRWVESHATNECSRLFGNCDGTPIDGDYTCTGGWCDGPAISECIDKCMSGNPNAISFTGGVNIPGEYLAGSLGATVTSDPREGLRIACKSQSKLANDLCAQKKLECDQAAECENPGFPSEFDLRGRRR